MSLVSIVVFHALVTSGEEFRRNWDWLVVASTVFDNRSLAILSFFLLFTRHDQDAYSALIAARARRLLVPFFVWTVIYVGLNLMIAVLSGEAHSYLAQTATVEFWLLGLLFGTVKYHLHFLPTLFILTLFLPYYRVLLPVVGLIAIVASMAALRGIAEATVVGTVYAPSAIDLVVLSLFKTIEYLPLGLLAFKLAQPRTATSGAGWSKGRELALLYTLVFAVALSPEVMSKVAGAGSGQLLWVAVQAALGAVTMVLAAWIVLLPLAQRAGNAQPGKAWKFMRENALLVFLVHPFFIDLFHALAGQPDNLPAAAAKAVFALAASAAAALVLDRVSLPRWHT